MYNRIAKKIIVGFLPLNSQFSHKREWNLVQVGVHALPNYTVRPTRQNLKTNAPYLKKM